MAQHILQDFKLFLESSPTAWHAAVQICNRLASLDFIPLNEEERWVLEPGKKYFAVRGGSVAAFALPESAPTKAVILASHTDSPSLKLKPHPIVQKENMTLLGVEVYGGPLLSSWLNRDLAIAGRIVFKNGSGELDEKLVFIDDAPLFIPQLAIHLDREVNDKGLILNKQEHLLPIATLDYEQKNYLETLLRQHVPFQDLLTFDLFLVPTEPPRFLGLHGEMIGSYRIDNLTSAHACATALAKASKASKHTLQMAMFWDHEEIGSHSAEGAGSPFLMNVITRIAHSFKFDAEDIMRLKSHSLCISVDVTHAFNPNYSAKYEPNHQSLPGKGVVIKYSANQKYATNAVTGAAIMNYCQAAGVPFQSYANRSDIAGGSTVGPIVANGLGIATVDIGPAIFSMHSSREVMSCQDHMYMCALLTQALQEG